MAYNKTDFEFTAKTNGQLKYVLYKGYDNIELKSNGLLVNVEMEE